MDTDKQLTPKCNNISFSRTNRLPFSTLGRGTRTHVRTYRVNTRNFQSRFGQTRSTIKQVNYSNINNNNNNNNDSMSDDNELDISDREEDTNDLELQCKRVLQGDGTIVFNFSNENVEIRMPRCYVEPDTKYRPPPSVCIFWTWDKDKHNYDHMLQYQANSITLPTGNFGNIPFDVDTQVYFRGQQNSDRKKYVVNVPRNTQVTDGGECFWNLQIEPNRYISVLNRQFSLMRAPRMFHIISFLNNHLSLMLNLTLFCDISVCSLYINDYSCCVYSTWIK